MALFTLVKRITEQLIRLELDRVYYVRFDEKIFKAKPVTKARASSTAEDGPSKQPPMLSRVTLLSEMKDGTLVGERGQIIIPTVLFTELVDFYPEHSYVGKIFQIIRHRLEGKSYNTFEVSEVHPTCEIIEEEGARPHSGYDQTNGEPEHDPETGEITERDADEHGETEQPAEPSKKVTVKKGKRD
jgi:hypothetical protein